MQILLFCHIDVQKNESVVVCHKKTGYARGDFKVWQVFAKKKQFIERSWSC